MGAVHGVYLKYVGLSALSYVGCRLLQPETTEDGVLLSSTLGLTVGRSLSWSLLPCLLLGYACVVNGLIAVLFVTERGMMILGKDPRTGTIPWWSYLIWCPFHIPTRLYTHLHTWYGKYLHTPPVPVATEVQPGWWIGGCYGHELNKTWAGIVDLTVEFPETAQAQAYVSAPTWDGIPLAPADLERVALFAVAAQKQTPKPGGATRGDVLVHCAHGRGRSTTVMCACLVKAGLYDHWQTAFEQGIKPHRPVCKLNKRMRENLTMWQAEFVDGKKGA